MLLTVCSLSLVRCSRHRQVAVNSRWCRVIRCEAPSPTSSTEKYSAKYGWKLDTGTVAHRYKGNTQIHDLPIGLINRPLGRTRANDQEKVAALMESIEEVGLKEPIDVLEVDGRYYGFSGCHRFEAHVKLGRETIVCRVRKATPRDLKLHMM